MYNKTLLELLVLTLFICGTSGFIVLAIIEYRHGIKRFFSKIHKLIDRYVEYTRKR